MTDYAPIAAAAAQFDQATADLADAVAAYTQKRALVRLDVEYGHEDYLWVPDLTTEELIHWWTQQDDVVPYWQDPHTLPGVLLPLPNWPHDVRDLIPFWCALHTNDDSSLSYMPPALPGQDWVGEVYFHAGYVDDDGGDGN